VLRYSRPAQGAGARVGRVLAAYPLWISGTDSQSRQGQEFEKGVEAADEVGVSPGSE